MSDTSATETPEAAAQRLAAELRGERTETQRLAKEVERLSDERVRLSSELESVKRLRDMHVSTIRGLCVAVASMPTADVAAAWIMESARKSTDWSVAARIK